MGTQGGFYGFHIIRLMAARSEQMGATSGSFFIFNLMCPHHEERANTIDEREASLINLICPSRKIRMNASNERQVAILIPWIDRPGRHRLPGHDALA